jgi:hypothetical protein
VQVLAVCDVDTTRRENARKTVEEFFAERVGQKNPCVTELIEAMDG